MTQENQFDDWVAESSIISPVKKIQTRWCPSHRRWEDADPGERLRCSLAWRDQYALEREVESERISPNAAMLMTARSIEKLAEEISYGERVIAEPPTRPPPPPPPRPSPNYRQTTGRGGVELP